MSLFHKFTLGVAGLTALGIGLAIAVTPHGFYASYGLSLGTNPTLLSELRAPGANLAALGMVIFAGAFRIGLARFSAALGTLVFFAFAFGRLVGIIFDGWPGESTLAALAIELVMALFCLLSLRGQTRTPIPATV